MTKGVGDSTIEAELAGLTPWTTAAPAISPDERAGRIEHARRLMAERNVDALLIGAGPSLNYFAGVPWGASERLVALILYARHAPVLIAPMFELGSLQADLGIEARVLCWEEDEDPYAITAAALAEASVSLLAIDPAMAFHMVARLRAAFQ